MAHAHTVTNTIRLSEDRCASREHGVFAVRDAGAGTELVYTDCSHFGSTVDGARVHRATVTLLASTGPTRPVALVLGRTALRAELAPVRVCLLADDSTRTGAAQRGAAAAAQLGVAVADAACATHFVLRGDATSRLAALTPELLLALASARPVLAASWLARAAAPEHRARLLAEGLPRDLTRFPPRVAAAALPGLVPATLRPDPARAHALAGTRLALGEGVPPLYTTVLRAAGAAVGSAEEEDTTVLVLQRTGPHQMTVDELARRIIGGSADAAVAAADDAPKETTGEAELIEVRTPVKSAPLRAREEAADGADAPVVETSGDSTTDAIAVTDVANTPRKRFRKSLVHVPTAYVDVGDHGT